MVVNKTRYLDGFFKVHSSDTDKINVISYHSMEDLFTKRVTKDGDLSEKRSIFVDRDVYWNVVDRMR